MQIVHNKNPIEQSFRNWINNYPESFHWCDINRFYIFVKCVCCYGRKTKDYQWLKKKIEKTGKKLPKDVIDEYCHKFVEFQKFHNTSCMKIYEY